MKPRTRQAVFDGILQAIPIVFVTVFLLLASAYFQRDEPRLQQDVGRERGRAERAEAQIRHLKQELHENRTRIRELERLVQRLSDDAGPGASGIADGSSPSGRPETPPERDEGDDPEPEPPPEQPPPSPDPDCEPTPIGCIVLPVRR